MNKLNLVRYVLLIFTISYIEILPAENLNKYCRCSDITPVKLWNADSWLWLSSKDKKSSVSKHLPWGKPVNTTTSENEKTLVQRDYILEHDGDLRTSIWAGYKLTKSNVNKERERTECFRKDIRVKQSHAGYCSDYNEPIYDQGHIVPNSDMKRTLKAMLNTYMMSNMSPQHCNFNRGSWLILEQLVRHWTKDKNKLYIMSGAVFDRDGTPGRDADSDALRMTSDSGKNRVAVPSHFYKILIKKNPSNTFETLSILLPHTNDKLPTSSSEKDRFFTNNIKSIKEIESMTGLSFFPELVASHPTIANALKERKPTSLWTLPDTWPRRLDQRCNSN